MHKAGDIVAIDFALGQAVVRLKTFNFNYHVGERGSKLKERCWLVEDIVTGHGDCVGESFMKGVE